MKSYYQLTKSGFMMISKEIWETGGKQKCANLAHAVVDLTRGAVSFSSTVDTPDEIDFQAFDNAGWEDDRLSADDGNENLSNYLDSGLLVREGNDIDPATAWMCSQITRKHDPRATRKAKHQ